eukprot:1246534-Amphidinium_carterae.1
MSTQQMTVHFLIWQRLYEWYLQGVQKRQYAWPWAAQKQQQFGTWPKIFPWPATEIEFQQGAQLSRPRGAGNHSFLSCLNCFGKYDPRCRSLTSQQELCQPLLLPFGTQAIVVDLRPPIAPYMSCVEV